ncbi:phosphoinositide 3-kinase C2 domain protein [Dictyocaulus viviparus]|uniref:Phosphoinositide 3-kinase C2 domain protein n=1 Tax=Dictyocaulus viviparus TaxID=29172 RepID=A0A0D8XC93_DICVI|nr:phosphoinositide 3-kinase C2 domain protein [Dictyocaulus viviparus]
MSNLLITDDTAHADIPGPSGIGGEFIKMGVRKKSNQQLPARITHAEAINDVLKGLYDEWEERKKMAVSQFSMKATDYVFRALRKSTGEMEEFYNEELLLSKIDFSKPYPILSLFEPESFRHERDLAQLIGQVIGYSLDDLEMELTDELKTCRAALFKDTCDAVNTRSSEGYSHYAFPEAVILDVVQPCPHALIAKIKSANLNYEVYFRTLENEIDNVDHGAVKEIIDFQPDMTPTSLVARVDVRSAFDNYRSPRFVLRRKRIVLLDYVRPRPIHKPNYVRAEESRLASGNVIAGVNNNTTASGALNEGGEASISLWDVDENLSMRPLSCSNMDTSDMDSHISVEFTVYCGKTLLVQKVSEKVPSHNPRWVEEMMSFDLYMKDLPPAAILTVHLMETKLKKGKQEGRVLGWANIRMFDWRGELLQGITTLNLWGGEPQIPPHGKIGNNDKKFGSNCRLIIELDRYRSPRVRMPDSSQFAPFVRFIRLTEKPEKTRSDEFSVSRVLNIIRKHLLGGALSAEEEVFVWDQRSYVSEHIPDALLIIAEAEVTWRKREHFTELYVMLEDWGRLTIPCNVNTFRCMDPIIRRFAVKQLELALDNQTFPLFILPFIQLLFQALKCEAWSYTPLSCLLLKKALSDYRIGHKLFWLLRAELANLKYVEMVDLLNRLSILVKGIREKDIATERLREELRNNCPSLEKIDSPLDPGNSLGYLQIDKCRVLGSAKMPLLLSWQNRSPLAEYYLPTYEIIFKNGDDLRQDMLVVHVLEVMDSIWKKNQLNCCLSTYPVLPMGTKYGMIGVVPNCSTIFEIQSEGGWVGTAVKSLETTFINRYIKNSAGSTKKYMECVDRFMMSCDRHNDNIMMTHDGKLFHIDFGHILGHGKTKLGIKRDRVPFVLTEHFLCVIGQGRPVSKDSHEVAKFKKLCCNAYMMLWEKRDLFLSLFTVMQSMELPELSTESDLDHLKSTLRVAFHNGMAAEARSFFSEIFDEAFNGSWATKTNWFFHAVKHI